VEASQHKFEESLTLNRKLLLTILAAVPAFLMPLAASGKSARTSDSAAAEQEEITYKYEAFAGYGYTSLNQVNQSRFGLQGLNLSITRDWGKYFGIAADGAAYTSPIAAGNPCPPAANSATQPTNCSAEVDAVLLGPVFHGTLFRQTSAFFHVLLGGEHTGGYSQTPSVSFAGGFGGGLEYKLRPHIALRASGDDIGSSFSVTNPVPGDSPHLRMNARAAVGIVYKF
jgi:hypothetical protein